MKNYGTRPLQLFSLIRTDTHSKKPAGSYQLLQNAMMMIICFEFWFLVPYPLKILKLKSSTLLTLKLIEKFTLF